MEMRKCERGHYYDAATNQSCPYCRQMQNSQAEHQTGGIERTVALNNVQDTMQVARDSGKTVALFQTKQGIDPVVGWLIAINGTEKGKDYRIHTDNNFIGRGERMDISIRSDETISRENQAIITYDSAERVYYFSPGEGRSINRLNGKAIFQTTELKPYDRITLGKTEFIFMPLCGKEFQWETEE